MTIKRQAAREAAAALGDVPRRLAALADMTVAQLAERYRELYDEPTRSRNKDYLRKRLAWRIQELAEGGLSEKTIAKVAELGDQLPERWRMRHAAPAPARAEFPEAAAPRDPRLPPAGTILKRVHDGVAHEVTVAAAGFEYRGEAFKSLSAVARRITGTPWNGFIFFGLPAKAARRAA